MNKEVKKALIWPAIGIPIAIVALMIDWRAAALMLFLWVIENQLRVHKMGGFKPTPLVKTIHGVSEMSKNPQIEERYTKRHGGFIYSLDVRLPGNYPKPTMEEYPGEGRIMADCWEGCEDETRQSVVRVAAERGFELIFNTELPVKP